MHERGYRKYQSEASCKEHLASAVVLLSNRRFHQPLRDPCCGGGTLLIEAARIAANIPPGNHRSFAFQDFPNYEVTLWEQLLAEADTKRIEKTWTLVGSDVDIDMVQAAKENAELAGVGNYITFVHQDVCATPLPAPLDAHLPTTVIANPPYDMRMQSDQTKRVHQRLATLILQKGRSGAVISAYAQAKSLFLPSRRKHNEIRQGATPARIFTKKI